MPLKADILVHQMYMRWREQLRSACAVRRRGLRPLEYENILAVYIVYHSSPDCFKVFLLRLASVTSCATVGSRDACTGFDLA